MARTLVFSRQIYGNRDAPCPSPHCAKCHLVAHKCAPVVCGNLETRAVSQDLLMTKIWKVAANRESNAQMINLSLLSRRLNQVPYHYFT